MEKTFVLGVGCQKGGTSWLFRYLDTHPDVNMGFKKEYHIFDALHLPEFAFFRERRTDFYRLIRKGRIFNPLRVMEAIRFRRFYRDPACYFDYFDSLLNAKSDCSLTGDITPSYSGLPSDVYAFIKESLETRGFRVKVVFIMRDPVERCISSMRMTRRNAGGTPVASESDDLLSNYASPIYQHRTQYEKTITSLEAVFPPDDILYAFYERLFVTDSIREITDFLGISYVKPDFQKKVNVSNTRVVISDDVKREVFDFYKETYNFISSRYGKEFLASIWSNYQKFGLR